MPRAIHPELVPYVRGFNTAKDYFDAMVIERTAAGAQMAHIRQDRGAWAEADGGAAAVDALFTRHDNGDLSLKGTLATVIEHPVGAITYLTTLQQAGRVDAFMLEANAPVSIANVQAYLNPRRDTGQRREVVTWRLRLFGVTEVLGLNGNPAGTFVNLVELAEPNDVAVAGDTAGLVTFEYDDQPEGPLSRETRQDSSGLIPGIFMRGMIFGVIYALDANGNTAGNVGQGYDAGTAEVTSGSYKLRGRRLELDTSGHSITRGFWRDEGSSGGTPYVKIETGSFTEETIEFTSGNLFDLGAAPAKDVELVGLVATPPGTSATLRVRNAADTDWVTFTNGQFESEDLGLALIQSKKMQATLTPNAAGNRSPRLRALGRQAIDRIDFSRVATLENYEQAFSPETHKVEIPRPRLVAVKDGQRDFASKIETLLAENFINDIRVRWFVGDAALGRDKWTHMETFLVLDSSPKKPVIELQLVGLCALLKDLAPPFSPGVNYAPDGDVSLGGWTDLAGGGANVYQGIDEDEPSELDGARSPTSPTDDEFIWTFPTPSDIAGRRLFLDVDYAKDQAGGEVIDGKFRIYNNATLVMETATQADVGADRVRKTFELTEAQIAQLTDLANLRGAVVANTPAAGVGRRLHLYWARFRSGGRREVVTYLNQSLKDVYDDLMENRLAIPANLRGPGVENDTTTVSKQITGLRKRSGGKDVIAKTELEAIAFLADGIIISSEGRIQFAELRSGQPIRAFFPSRRITIGEASPGHEQRIPEYFVPLQWDAEREEFKNEVRAFHADSLLRLGTLGLGPPKWLDEEIAKWIDTDPLAETVGQRTVERLGTGKMLWSWESSDRYHELRAGDLVAVETDLFVSRDPTLDAEVRGRRWAVGPLQRAGKGWSFTIHVRGFADIRASAQAASRVLGLKLKTVETVFRDDHLHVLWVADPQTRSVKIATSTTAQPAAGTGTIAEGQTGTFDVGGGFSYTQVPFVTVTPYSGAGGTGVQGEPRFLRMQQLMLQGFIDADTGTPNADPAAQGSSIAINGDFERGMGYWRRDPASLAGSTVTIETGANKYSGDKSLKLVTPNTGDLIVDQVDRVSDESDATSGNLVYIPADGSGRGWEVHGRCISKKSSALEVGTLHIEVKQYDASKALISVLQVASLTLGTSYAEFGGGVALSSTCRFITLRVRLNGPSGGLTAWADDLKTWLIMPKLRCKVYNSAAQSINNNTETLLTWDSENHDIGGLHSTASNTGRIVPPAMIGPGFGLFLLIAQVQWAAGTTGYRRVRIRHADGSGGFTTLAEDTRDGTTTVETTQIVTAYVSRFVYDSAVPDYFDVVVQHTQGAALNVNGGLAASYFAFVQLW